MYSILKFINEFSELAALITPLTLVIGIINSIKISDERTIYYKIMEIVSGYLIFLPLIFNTR